MTNTMNDFRRKLANAISPDKEQSYPIVELNWSTPESENRKQLERAHYNFLKEFGYSGTDEEVWKYNREQLNITLDKLGLEPASTEFIPERFGK